MNYKKLVFPIALVLAVVITFSSCASRGRAPAQAPASPPPAPPPTSAPAPAPVVSNPVTTAPIPAAPVDTTEEAFVDVYNRHRSDLILDGAVHYTVKRGDTLVNIAKVYYRSGFDYPIIMLASSDIVLDPDKIEPGMILAIPDLNLNLNDARARASMKTFFLEMAVIEDMRRRSGTAVGLRRESDLL